MNQFVQSQMTKRVRITDHALLTLRGIVQVPMLIDIYQLVIVNYGEFASSDDAETLGPRRSKYRKINTISGFASWRTA